MTTVVTSSGDVIIFVRRAAERVREDSPWRDVREIVSSKDLFSFLKGFSSVGVPLYRMGADMYLRYLRELEGTTRIRDISRIMEEILSIKSDFEIECLKRSASIAEMVFQESLNYIKEGMTEIEIAGIFDMLGKKFGSESYLRTGSINYEAYTWHVVSGDNAFVRSYIETVVCGRGLSPSFPCGAGWRKIVRGEPFLVDFGTSYMGYLIDHARTLVIGEPSFKTVNMYSKIMSLRDAVEAFMKPGAMCSEIFEFSKSVALNLGIGDYYLGGSLSGVNFLAHGIGLELSDKPIIGKGQDYPLEVGMTFAMEPKMLVPGVGPLGVEDVYVVRDDGVERITGTLDSIITIRSG